MNFAGENHCVHTFVYGASSDKHVAEEPLLASKGGSRPLGFVLFVIFVVSI